MAEAVEIAADRRGSACTCRTTTARASSWRPLWTMRSARGLDLTFDTYPYRRGCTLLAMAALPAWLDHADAGPALAALADPPTRARITGRAGPAAVAAGHAGPRTR